MTVCPNTAVARGHSRENIPPSTKKPMGSTIPHPQPKIRWGLQYPILPKVKGSTIPHHSKKFEWGFHSPPFQKFEWGFHDPTTPKSSNGAFISPTLQKVENWDFTPLHSFSPSKKNKPMVLYVPPSPKCSFMCMRPSGPPPPPPNVERGPLRAERVDG